MSMHGDAKSLREQGDRLFSQKQSYDRLNQEIADHFYPQRASFTTVRDPGEEFANHLMTGYPVMVHRDLSNQIGTMLRPRGQPWFHVSVTDKSRIDHEARAWLEQKTQLQRQLMYDRRTNFARATKEGDADFAAFGGCCISTEVNRRDNALLYRCWHLRDVAWTEDSYGQHNATHINWKPKASELRRMFKNVHHKVEECGSDRAKDRDIHVRRVVIRADGYDWKKSRHPWVALYIDVDNEFIMEEVGVWTKQYTLPRWATTSGSQYAYSPATIVALPDARLVQAMTLTLLDAGERAANPPLIGVSEAISGDMNIYAGGFTAVDKDYDERLGEVLRPLTQDKSGLPYGIEMLDRTTAMVREAFYLNTLSLPPTGGPDMTAYEVSQRVQEYIRNALPLFEPIETEYNGELCEITFETLLREGALGSIREIPESLQGAEMEFEFESPLADLIEREKGQKFLEAKAMIAEATAVDESASQIIDFGAALRDVLAGIGAPAAWLRSPEQVREAQEMNEQAGQAQQLLAAMQGGANVAATLGDAAQSFQQVRRPAA
jgi:hypothetical protein